MLLSRSRLIPSPSRSTPLQTVLLAESIDDFARGCQELLRTLVPYHSLYVSFNGLDYWSPRLFRDTLHRSAEIFALHERYNVFNPTRTFLREHYGIQQAFFKEQIGTLSEAAREAFLIRYKEKEGWDKYMEMYFWSAGALQGTICVRRSREQPDFTAKELRCLAELQASLAPCVSRLHRQHRDRLRWTCLHQVLGGLPIPLLVLSWDFEPVLINEEARRACAEWLLGPREARALKLGQFARIPEEILAACEAEKAAHAADTCATPCPPPHFTYRFRNVAHPTHENLSAQIKVLDVRGDFAAPPYFLVGFRHANLPTGDNLSDENRNANALAALSCLTPCEREIALQVKNGLTNHEIAARLSKSVPTVKMHVRSVFRKLNVSNRTRIALLLNG